MINSKQHLTISNEIEESSQVSHPEECEHSSQKDTVKLSNNMQLQQQQDFSFFKEANAQRKLENPLNEGKPSVLQHQHYSSNGSKVENGSVVGMQSVTVTRIQGLSNSSGGNRAGSNSSRQSLGPDKKVPNNPFRQNHDEESVNTSKGGSVNGSSSITPPQFGGRNGHGIGAPSLNIDEANA